MKETSCVRRMRQRPASEGSGPHLWLQDFCPGQSLSPAMYLFSYELENHFQHDGRICYAKKFVNRYSKFFSVTKPLPARASSRAAVHGGPARRRVHSTQSAMKIFVSPRTLPLRFEAKTSCLPSGVNIGKPSNSP